MSDYDDPPNLVAAARVWGAMRSTVDTFTTTTTLEQNRLLGRRGLEAAALAGVQHAQGLALDGYALDPGERTRSAVDQFLIGQPNLMSQLPLTLPPEQLATLGPSSNLPQMLLEQWAKDLRDPLMRARTAWLTAIERRLDFEHPLVRVAVPVMHDNFHLDRETLVGTEPLDVTDTVGGSGIYLTSMLMHPNEAEVLLRPTLENTGVWHVESYFLVPSAGVSEARLETALALQRDAVKPGVGDPPMRSLVHALVAAADVLGEPTLGAPGAPSEKETVARLTSRLAKVIASFEAAPF